MNSLQIRNIEDLHVISKADTARLLSFLSVYDNRVVTEGEIEGWQVALADEKISYAHAKQAAFTLVKQQSGYLRVHHIIAKVRASMPVSLKFLDKCKDPVFRKRFEESRSWTVNDYLASKGVDIRF